MRKYFIVKAAFSILFAALCIAICVPCALAAPKLTEARVLKVHDGDTLTVVLEGREYRTRLVGIDAPEMGQGAWGKNAKKHLIKIMKQNNWKVHVETDVVKLDKYNRLLAYLWTRDHELINEQMVRDGYAALFTIQPNSKYVDRFKKAQRIARENRAGIWGPDGLKETPLDYKKKHPRE